MTIKTNVNVSKTKILGHRTSIDIVNYYYYYHYYCY